VCATISLDSRSKKKGGDIGLAEPIVTVLFVCGLYAAIVAVIFGWIIHDMRRKKKR
jgi:hypothetical protein